MTIDELIKELQEIRKKYGDIEVCCEYVDETVDLGYVGGCSVDVDWLDHKSGDFLPEEDKGKRIVVLYP